MTQQYKFIECMVRSHLKLNLKYCAYQHQDLKSIVYEKL
jgi:hypothetical protein